jgi:hypothetical protein
MRYGKIKQDRQDYQDKNNSLKHPVKSQSILLEIPLVSHKAVNYQRLRFRLFSAAPFFRRFGELLRARQRFDGF